MMKRRDFSGALAAALVGWALPQISWASVPGEFARLEKEVGGRLGVAVLDTASGRLTGHRLGERFPMCSTFKALAAACVLRRAEQGQSPLDRRIRYTKADLVAYSPVTEPQAGGEGLTLAQLCEATITLSDNTAANLILREIGGPAALTAFLRTAGDQLTRLDRTEPALNEARPGDPRDTTTPEAMARTLQRLVLGDAQGHVLAPASREQLRSWMLATKTSDKRFRARLPAGWQVADKTGSGSRGTSNDAGLLFPPAEAKQGAPLVVAAYLTGSPASGEQRDAALARVAELAATLRA